MSILMSLKKLREKLLDEIQKLHNFYDKTQFRGVEMKISEKIELVM